MGGPEVEAFLTHLAAARGLSVSSHRQALSALLFLYGKVIGQDLPWMNEIGRPVPKRRLPVVLSGDEVAAVLRNLKDVHDLLARLLYGTGLRIEEALQLRVKDLDFANHASTCALAKGAKTGWSCCRSPWGRRSNSKSRSARGLAGLKMLRLGVRGFNCPMRWSASTHAPGRAGLGFGSFLSSACPSTREVA